MSKSSIVQDFKQIMAAPGFPAFFVFRVLAGFSGWMQVALIYPVLVFHFSASPLVVGVVIFLLGVPFVLVGPYLGSLADQRSPVALLTAGSVGHLICLAALGWAPSLEIFAALLVVNALIGTTGSG
jgi:predicted MFS family arabinose efflux permease